MDETKRRERAVANDLLARLPGCDQSLRREREARGAIDAIDAIDARDAIDAIDTVDDPLIIKSLQTTCRCLDSSFETDAVRCGNDESGFNQVTTTYRHEATYFRSDTKNVDRARESMTQFGGFNIKAGDILIGCIEQWGRNGEDGQGGIEGIEGGEGMDG